MPPTPLSSLGLNKTRTAPSSGGPGSPCPRWDSRTLLGQAEQAEIHHGDQVYRLRLTALGKLILTK
ncbi:hemin uptake protein HemP [Ideonella oryzae]|uniref:Hemin uptake protein HemP n=1 Tax=Ideonella oryzae TaxID=2937441 RepID=A0ABT1BHY9_9BURK|nr:hemin uptake protein HemP [Ideonella oryzae]MCO5975835.1 hemin uptake protein HemP [Ideonella oryzae]